MNNSVKGAYMAENLTLISYNFDQSQDKHHRYTDVLNTFFLDTSLI